MISIHMTTHRRFASGLLQQAIESVLSQDFEDFEFIICDDASVDGTADYLARLVSTDRRFRVFRNARNVNNVAISLGRCMQRSDAGRPWVSWMFDDCILLPQALSRLITALSEHPSQGMLYGVTEVLQKDGSTLRVGGGTQAEVKAGIARSSILVPNGGIVVHRDIFKRVGFFDSSVILRRSCDWDLFRRIIQDGIEFLVLPDILMREFGDQQPNSLRNTFTTTFDLMTRFVAARDSGGVRLDLENVLVRPVDWIPPGAWSAHDLNLMRYMFVEYFLSVGDIARSYRWSRLLAESLGNQGLLMRENLFRVAASAEMGEQRAMAAGAFAGVVLGAWREQWDSCGGNRTS